MLKLALLPLQLLVSALVLGGTEASGCSKALSFCLADWSEPWTYRGLNGPKHWNVTYEQCRGKNQSPIAIVTKDAEMDENLLSLAFDGYGVPLTKAKLENNGHSAEAIPGDSVNRTIDVDGKKYGLHQFHFHWGRKNCNGSEHTLDGQQYTMEMHLVHLSDNGSIAVVGIFFQEQDKDNEDLRPIVDELPKLTYKGSKTELTTPLNLNNLLPANRTYFRYDGSLTTPECDEGVKWSVLKDPMPVGKKQMDEFRKLSSAVQGKAIIYCPLSDNYRPVQPLNARKVSKSP